MEASSRVPTLQRSPCRGLTWSLVIAIILSAAAMAGCGKEEVAVPDVVGMKTGAAQEVLEAVGLELGDIERLSSDATEEADTVVTQLPAAGTEVETGSQVAVVATAEDESADESASPSGTAGGGSTGGGSASGGGSGTEAEPAAEPETEPEAETEADPDWHTVVTYSGRSNYVSPTFSTTSSRLQLSVVVTSPSNGWFGFRVGTDAMPGPVYQVQGTAEEEKETFVLTRPSGRYHLRVQAPTDGEWTARVRELR